MRARTAPARRPAASVLALVLAGLLGLLGLAGCTGAPAAPTGGDPTTLPAPSSAASTPGEQAADPANARFYDQDVRWTGCGKGLECARVTVPVDWSAPSGAVLQLAVDRWPARDAGSRAGALLLNPGGPGGSGVDWVRTAGRGVVSADVADRYDLVGFDPRGVGASRPVDCLPDPALDAYLADDVDPDAPGGLAELTARSTAFARGCAASAGPLLGHLGTVDAARDLDVLRAVTGSPRLDYLGKSYGTLLGATYAGLFPTRVGRFVLDGALDPASSYPEVSLVQARGLESSLRAYAAGCSSRRGCPLASTTDAAVQQVRDVLDAADRAPLRTRSGRPLTGPLATTGVITPLYDDGSWPVLDQALAAARQGDGTGLLQLADAYSGRRPDGTYASNLLEAFTAINCLDYPVDDSVPVLRAEEGQLEQASPTFGKSLAFGEVQCGVWPVPPTRTPAPVSADGSPPILVVGTTDDPATPYVWARSLARQLSAGRLLTWHGEGHTAYGRGSSCVDAAVDGYLLDGVLPGEGATCRD